MENISENGLYVGILGWSRKVANSWSNQDLAVRKEDTEEDARQRKGLAFPLFG